MKKQYLWCLHCERVFSVDEWLAHENLCPSCDTSAFLNAWNWEDACKDFRFKNDYPDTPESGKFYPMYPDRKAAIPAEGSMARSMAKTLTEMKEEGLFDED